MNNAQDRISERALRVRIKMAEEWREARLIPISGIRGSAEQEGRATSALLSVMKVVPSFAHAILKPCGAPLGKVRSNVETYIEVTFEDKKNKRAPRPDGLIRVTRGKTTWTALVEVKTASNSLEKEQIESYMDVARDNQFDAVITISNEIPPVLGSLPFALDGRKLRHTPVYHFSWVRLISMAIMEKEVHGIDDPEQTWILGELIRYLEHENSGALDFTDMGPSWTPVIDAVRTGLVKKDDQHTVDIATKFDGLVRYVCLKMGQRLGVEVTPRLSRKEVVTPEYRTSALAEELESNGTLSARIAIPGTVADLRLRCDIRARQICTMAVVPASGQARNQTRVNWLLRPLEEDLEDVVIEAQAPRRVHAANIKEFREDLNEVLPANFPEIQRFAVSQMHPMGLQKTTSGRTSFINSVVEAIDSFYVKILQRQRAWTPPAPKYTKPMPEHEAEETFSSAEIASADGSGADSTISE